VFSRDSAERWESGADVQRGVVEGTMLHGVAMSFDQISSTVGWDAR
jgi:hypothetical protein